MLTTERSYDPNRAIVVWKTRFLLFYPQFFNFYFEVNVLQSWLGYEKNVQRVFALRGKQLVHMAQRRCLCTANELS